MSDVPRLSSKVFGSVWAPDRFVADYGGQLCKMQDPAEFDFLHRSGARIELKAARARVRDGVLVFQYIRPSLFDVCVALGWQSTGLTYWIFESRALLPYLSRQHRGGNSYQLRISRNSSSKFRKHMVVAELLHDRLDALITRALRHRNPIRLDPVLELVEGWLDVSTSMRRMLKGSGLESWVFAIRPLTADHDVADKDDSELLPSPTFFDDEHRVECWVRPEPILRRWDATMQARILVEFLDMYLTEKNESEEADLDTEGGE